MLSRIGRAGRKVVCRFLTAQASILLNAIWFILPWKHSWGGFLGQGQVIITYGNKNVGSSCPISLFRETQRTCSFLCKLPPPSPQERNPVNRRVFVGYYDWSDLAAAAAVSSHLPPSREETHKDFIFIKQRNLHWDGEEKGKPLTPETIHFIIFWMRVDISTR